MIKKHFVAVLLCLAFQAASAQQDSVIAVKSYSFLILDRPAQFSTIRQFDQNYLSLYRLYSDQLHKHLTKKVAFGIQMLTSVLTVPLSHEEGHRSVLTYKNIGSVSKPYFNSKGAAYVVRVRDSELQQLRDTDLPTYIRVHTAGAESDYMVSLASERLLTFEEDDYRTIGVEYLFRKI